jgi:hypothetical protein
MWKKASKRQINKPGSVRQQDGDVIYLGRVSSPLAAYPRSVVNTGRVAPPLLGFAPDKVYQRCGLPRTR